MGWGEGSSGKRDRVLHQRTHRHPFSPISPCRNVRAEPAALPWHPRLRSFPPTCCFHAYYYLGTEDPQCYPPYNLPEAGTQIFL